MSDYIDENDGVPSEPSAETAAEPVAKSPRGRKPKAASESPKRKITIKKRTRVTVRKQNDDAASPAETAAAEDTPEVQEETAFIPESVEAEAAADAPAPEEASIIPEDMAPGVAGSAPAEEEVQEAEAKSYPAEKADRDYRGHRDKRMKNGKNRRAVEELPPEINIDEHPDAPRLYISVLTALHLDQLRDRAREAGIPEDVILDCRKQDLIAKMLRLHSASGGALFVEGVLEVLQDGSFGRGILICGTGLGMAMIANKVEGVYAGVCHDVYSAERLRKSNDAQVLTMGARVIGSELAKTIVDAWLQSEFQGGGSQPKVDQMRSLEKKSFHRAE